MNKLASILFFAATLSAPSAYASYYTMASPATNLYTVEANANATVQAGGPRSGGSGLAFFNIEGSGNGDFASYGVARFDLSAMKAGFDTTYGADGWKVDYISLELTQSNASFTTDGAVDVYFTDDDTTSIAAGSSPLKYPFAGDFADASKIMGYSFTAQIGSGMTTEWHSLFSTGGANVNSAGALALATDIESSDNLATLALVDADAAVAATYAGYTHSTFTGPRLNVYVTRAANVTPVPEADTWAMLIAGLGLVGFAARRRRIG